MKATGIVRRIDELGRVVIPIELRRILHIENGDPVEFLVDGGNVILRPYRPGCVLCGGFEALEPIGGNKPVCKSCREQAARVLAEEVRNE